MAEAGLKLNLTRGEASSPLVLSSGSSSSLVRRLPLEDSWRSSSVSPPDTALMLLLSYPEIIMPSLFLLSETVGIVRDLVELGAPPMISSLINSPGGELLL